MGMPVSQKDRKRLIHQDQGVPEFWIIHSEARLVERWRPREETRAIGALRPVNPKVRQSTPDAATGELQGATGQSGHCCW